jgi:hypothetical protein
MFKKVVGVILLVGLGYTIGQFIEFPNELFATEKTLPATVENSDKQLEIQQTKNSKIVDSAMDKKVESSAISSADVLIPANDEIIEYGLWLGLYSDAGVKQMIATLPKEYSQVAQFSFINAANEEMILLVLGPFNTEQQTQLVQHKLTNEYSINTSLIKYPQIKKEQ